MTRRAHVLAAWRRYWFAPASLADLGAARVVLVGIWLALGAGSRYRHLAGVPLELWTPIPLASGLAPPSAQSLEWLARGTVALLVAAGLGVGARPALFLLLPFLVVQEGLLNSVGKVTHATLPLLWATLFLALAPCDRAISLSALARRRRSATLPPRTSTLARWPLDLLFVELAAYYATAGLSKLRDGGLAWADGFTLQYHLLAKGTAAGAWLAAEMPLCRALSILVLVFELGFVAGIVRRLRPLVLGGGVLFHLGTTVFLNVSFWPVVAVYALFVPWSRLAPRRTPPAA